MKLFKNQLALFALSMFIFGNANAITVDISLSAVTQSTDISFTFGNYIFKMEDESDINGLLVTDSFGGILSGNAINGGDFRLSRTDLGFFSLESIFHSGSGITTIGGVPVSHTGSSTLDPLLYPFPNGDAGVTNVSSILFSFPTPPSSSDFIRIHSFEVQAVPVPAAAWLFGSGLLGLVGVARRKKA